MLSGCEIVDPLTHPSWDELVLKHSDATIFHSSAWARVLSDSYGYRPFYFTLFDSSAIYACLPVMEVNSCLTGRRGVSLPFTDFCEPLASSEGPFLEVLDQATGFGRRRGWKSLELRGSGPSFDLTPASAHYFSHSLDLSAILATDSQDRLPFPSSFRDNTRRNIRKALRNGVRIEISVTESSIKQFYGLNLITRKDHGLPPQPYRFFQLVHKHIVSQGRGFVALAFWGDKPVAGSVFFRFGNKAVYKYGASHKQYQHLRPNDLVMWEAIRWLAINGCESVSFGRTDLDHDGLRRFKLGWGATEETVNYHRYDIGAGSFVSNAETKVCLGWNKVFSHTPLPVLRAIGTVLYRHMG